MQTIKDVLSRKEERKNLKQVGFCFLTVTMLVVGSFGLTTLAELFDNGRGESAEDVVAVTEVVE